MKKRNFTTKEKLFLFITIIALSTALFIRNIDKSSPKESLYITQDGFAQGGTYHIVYKESSLTQTINLPDSLKSYFNNINRSISGYDSLSIISKINRNEDALLDSIFINTFNSSMEVFNASKGAFDISGGPLFNIWGFGFKNKEQVTKEKIDSILTFVGMNKLQIKEGKLLKEDPRMQVNFNAIAQGYTCDYIGKKLEAMGVTDYLIEVGGEVLCKGVNSKGNEWRVGIDKPIDGNNIQGDQMQAIIEISNKGLVTSGNYRKFYIENGEKYAHTINPKSGYPVKHNLLSATVIAENATIADAYATYFMVIGLEEAKKVLEKTPNMDAFLIFANGDNMEVYVTDGVKIQMNN